MPIVGCYGVATLKHEHRVERLSALFQHVESVGLVCEIIAQRILKS